MKVLDTGETCNSFEGAMDTLKQKLLVESVHKLNKHADGGVGSIILEEWPRLRS